MSEGLLDTFESQFYIGSMVLALEYLHNNYIIYRDLKPDNIIVDHTGYIKLTEMGTSKQLKRAVDEENKTYTIIGTPHYMAPEIIFGKGYTQATDYWSLGICFYELMCGVVPFGEETDDPYTIYEEIVTKVVKYPNYFKDKKAKRLMEQLLSKSPEIRLGGSFSNLKGDLWFDNFDWDKLLGKKLSPPYFPSK